MNQSQQLLLARPNLYLWTPTRQTRKTKTDMQREKTAKSMRKAVVRLRSST